jgi:hypothetical protein
VAEGGTGDVAGVGEPGGMVAVDVGSLGVGCIGNAGDWVAVGKAGGILEDEGLGFPPHATRSAAASIRRAGIRCCLAFMVA